MSETAHSLGHVGLSVLLCGGLLACARPVLLEQQDAANPQAQAPPALQSPPTQTTPKTAVSSPPDEITLRTLDLIALDSDGRPVTDLKPEELRLFEDKVELKIASISSVANEPLTLGLFFDVSGSRHADQSIGEETRLASEFVHSIWHQGDTAFVVAFNYDVYAVTQPSQKLEDIDEGLKKIPQATYHGATALYDALCLVKPEKLASIPGRKVYVVFSDFEDNTSQNTSEHVLEVAHKAGISIFPVFLSEGFGGGYSKRIEKHGRQQALYFADATGGEVLIPESRKQLASTFAQLASALQAAYRMTYTPSTPDPVDKKRKKKKKEILLQTTRPHVRLIYAKS